MASDKRAPTTKAGYRQTLGSRSSRIDAEPSQTQRLQRGYGGAAALAVGSLVVGWALLSALPEVGGWLAVTRPSVPSPAERTVPFRKPNTTTDLFTNDLDFAGIVAPDPGIRPRNVRILFLNHHFGTTSEMAAITSTLSRKHGVDITFDDRHGIFATTQKYGVSRQEALDYRDHGIETECSWDRYDLIVVGDTMPLIRPHLENCCPLPMAVWLTTRFDWGMDDDRTWPGVIENASTWPNFRIHPNNHLEEPYFNALGAYPRMSAYLPGSGIPSHHWADALQEVGSTTPPNDDELVVPLSVRIDECLIEPLTRLGVAVTTYKRNRHGGPLAFTDRIVVHVPYQSNTMSLFENLHQRVIYVLPTLRLFRELGASCGAHIEKVQQDQFSDEEMESYMDWWRPDLKHLFFYFDSFDDLQEGSHLRRTIREQADAKRTAIALFMLQQRRDVLRTWEEILFTDWGEIGLSARKGCDETGIGG